MKKTVFATRRFVPVLFLALLATGVASAQKKQKTTPGSTQGSNVRVRIIERDGQATRQVDRVYRLNGLDDPNRDKLVMKLVDSLKATRVGGGNRQVTITIDELDSNRVASRNSFRQDRLRSFDNRNFQLPGNRGFSYEFWNDPSWQRELRRDTQALTDRMNRYRMQLPREFDRQLVRPFEDWSRQFGGKPSTIQGLEAYPNNPDRNQLNVRFTAPQKGDVTVVVLNTKGKEVGRKEIKDFSGDYFGQIDLGAKAQGVYFLMVTQNEDGTTRRIVVE